MLANVNRCGHLLFSGFCFLAKVTVIFSPCLLKRSFNFIFLILYDLFHGMHMLSFHVNLYMIRGHRNFSARKINIFYVFFTSKNEVEMRRFLFKNTITTSFLYFLISLCLCTFWMTKDLICTHGIMKNSRMCEKYKNIYLFSFALMDIANGRSGGGKEYCQPTPIDVVICYSVDVAFKPKWS